jgi:type II restriction enzyme
MNKDFNIFLSQLKETNQTLDFFCDFEKIGRNVDDIKLSLCMLNSLIGTSDLRKSVETIWNRDKTAFSVLPILIAVRDEGSKKVLDTLK